MRTLATTALVLLLSLTAAGAAEWPQNWLGPKDPEYVSLRIGVYYFGAVLHDFPDDEGNPALPGEPADWLATMMQRPELSAVNQRLEFDRVHKELDAAAEFIWRNSRFNCAVDYTCISDYSPRLRSQITGGEAPYFSPVDFEHYGAARDQYDGLLQIMVLYRYNDDTGELERIKGGGGFTWGCNAETGQCGWSWWAACTADNVCGSDWLVVHEFGHQLDSLFDQSGHPEFWFNHLAPSEGNCARFGEHFDANSYIMRRVPEADWLDLKWGSIRSATDADGDGVPAADQWLTSRGYTTDPDDSKPDTDGDGLTDYEEFMLANGNRNGHGERLHPLVGYCDPTDPDSDGDGLTDAEDPVPTLPMWDKVEMISVDSADSAAISFETLSIAELYELPRCFYATYLDENEALNPVCLLIEVPSPFYGYNKEDLEYKLMLDLDNNGWFYGSDNYQLNFSAAEIDRFVQHEASSHAEWPHVVTLDATQIPLVPVGDMGAFIVVLDHTLVPEFGGKPGEMIGLNIGVRHAGDPWYYMLGEPNTLIQFELR